LPKIVEMAGWQPQELTRSIQAATAELHLHDWGTALLKYWRPGLLIIPRIHGTGDKAFLGTGAFLGIRATKLGGGALGEHDIT
jgi:hypothetical protein